MKSEVKMSSLLCYYDRSWTSNLKSLLTSTAMAWVCLLGKLLPQYMLLRSKNKTHHKITTISVYVILMCDCTFFHLLIMWFWIQMQSLIPIWWEWLLGILLTKMTKPVYKLEIYDLKSGTSMKWSGLNKCFKVQTGTH